MINVALPKGRLGSSAYKLFEKLGCGPIEENTRKLKFTDEKTGLSFFWVKPSDVAIYVERGAADIGICGRDILLEEEPDVFELLDLGIGKCRMCVAGYADRVENPERPLRVATKFPNIAREYYSGLSREIDIIKLNGSIELAPIMGLSDVIVDIVESGATLRENGLAPLETVCDITARLVANKVSYKFKNAEIKRLAEALL
ncbi:MAG: ATP phosphoribosyltransferase [Oscillospiraceae bacterium]|nr:ATP phosphoribosyltransferase [Oscillospiraceae bacterium]MBQ2158086.1 ATP phosphoribosyltransferase [Oscillospiraceae bacterium]MBQ2330592.1 ATP phosphoribosyltransferase [Oscillospiraceae bacterium]MBQ3952038.1 ATP phosphoribosyltransferase [Oscillospiraceae bacterium]MBQ5504356.1 ATP phosphoribosyltransferase [Oscillospiraceae bacterium]